MEISEKNKEFLFSVMIIAAILAGVICLFRSTSLLSDYGDCSNLYDVPENSSIDSLNCAPAQIVLSSDIYYFIGIGLFILPIGVGIILLWKSKFSESDIINLLKNK
jgi:hypothetical protein